MSIFQYSMVMFWSSNLEGMCYSSCLCSFFYLSKTMAMRLSYQWFVFLFIETFYWKFFWIIEVIQKILQKIKLLLSNWKLPKPFTENWLFLPTVVDSFVPPQPGECFTGDSMCNEFPPLIPSFKWIGLGYNLDKTTIQHLLWASKVTAFFFLRMIISVFFENYRGPLAFKISICAQVAATCVYWRSETVWHPRRGKIFLILFHSGCFLFYHQHIWDGKSFCLLKKVFLWSFICIFAYLPGMISSVINKFC